VQLATYSTAVETRTATRTTTRTATHSFCYLRPRERRLYSQNILGVSLQHTLQHALPHNLLVTCDRESDDFIRRISSACECNTHCNTFCNTHCKMHCNTLFLLPATERTTTFLVEFPRRVTATHTATQSATRSATQSLYYLRPRERRLYSQNFLGL